MNDLISRQAILKHIEKIRQGTQMMDDIHRASIIMTGMHLCEEAVRNQPSAERKGSWVGIDDEPCETFECDRCGFVLEDWIQGALYNFCPNCGADMRERKES